MGIRPNYTDSEEDCQTRFFLLSRTNWVQRTFVGLSPEPKPYNGELVPPRR